MGIKHKERIGTDEAGKGDYFGHLVAAGVYTDEEGENFLTSAGVRDSKSLSDSGVLRLDDAIRKYHASNKEHLRFSIISISPKKYNELYEKIGNLNRLLAWAHARAIENLLKGGECEQVIADQFGDEKFLERSLMERGRKVKLKQMPRAEEDIAVASASILARAEFLRTLKRLSEKYKMEIPKGSTHVIETGKKLVAMYGEEVLDDAAKKHFKITGKITVVKQKR